MLNTILNYWWYYIRNVKQYELKLLKYQGYGTRSILNFKRANNIKWPIIKAILDNYQIIDGLEIRSIIREFVKSNAELINDNKTFITHFGPEGKSGGVILNQFNHCYPTLYYKIINVKNLNMLGDNSNIIFLDDIIGTGQQAIEYIKPILNSIGNSVNPYLFAICGTQSGIDRVNRMQTKFKIFSGKVLQEKDYFLLNDACNILSSIQKKEVLEIIKTLGHKSQFNQNIPVSFYYSTPDNALPLLWLDGSKYLDEKGAQKQWYGLVPRDY